MKHFIFPPTIVLLASFVAGAINVYGSTGPLCLVTQIITFHDKELFEPAFEAMLQRASLDTKFDRLGLCKYLKKTLPGKQYTPEQLEEFIDNAAAMLFSQARQHYFTKNISFVFSIKEPLSLTIAPAIFLCGLKKMLILNPCGKKRTKDQWRRLLTEYKELFKTHFNTKKQAYLASLGNQTTISLRTSSVSLPTT